MECVESMKFEVVRRYEDTFGRRAVEVLVNGKKFVVSELFEVEQFKGEGLNLCVKKWECKGKCLRVR